MIIGLGHRKRVGKNTFADMLEDELEERGYDVFKIALAADMKSMAHELFGMYGIRDAWHYEANPEHREIPLDRINKSPRQIWIEFGNLMRSIDPDIWVNRVKGLINNIGFRAKLNALKPNAFIITDVRYPNEAKAIKSWGGYVIKVIRPDAPRSDDVADCALENYTGWDYTVFNNSDLEGLGRLATELACILTYYKENNEKK